MQNAVEGVIETVAALLRVVAVRPVRVDMAFEAEAEAVRVV